MLEIDKIYQVDCLDGMSKIDEEQRGFNLNF